MSKVAIDLDEHSLDNSGDGELLGMVDEDTFDGRVTYRLVQMTSAEDSTVNAITTDSTNSGGSYFVFGNPVEVFGDSTSQKKVIRRDPLANKAITAKKRDDKRRATHNEVERRRRDKINTWITNLAALIPNSGLPDSASKGGILAKACDYITDLTEKQKRLEQMERDNENLVMQVLKLNEEVTELMRDNSSLRKQLSDHCITPHQRPKVERS